MLTRAPCWVGLRLRHGAGERSRSSQPPIAATVGNLAGQRSGWSTTASKVNRSWREESPVEAPPAHSAPTDDAEDFTQEPSTEGLLASQFRGLLIKTYHAQRRRWCGHTDSPQSADASAAGAAGRLSAVPVRRRFVCQVRLDRVPPGGVSVRRAGRQCRRREQAGVRGAGGGRSARALRPVRQLYAAAVFVQWHQRQQLQQRAAANAQRRQVEHALPGSGGRCTGQPDTVHRQRVRLDGELGGQRQHRPTGVVECGVQQFLQQLAAGVPAVLRRVRVPRHRLVPQRLRHHLLQQHPAEPQLSGFGADHPGQPVLLPRRQLPADQRRGAPVRRHRQGAGPTGCGQSVARRSQGAGHSVGPELCAVGGRGADRAAAAFHDAHHFAQSGVRARVGHPADYADDGSAPQHLLPGDVHCVSADLPDCDAEHHRLRVGVPRVVLHPQHAAAVLCGLLPVGQHHDLVQHVFGAVFERPHHGAHIRLDLCGIDRVHRRAVSGTDVHLQRTLVAVSGQLSAAVIFPLLHGVLCGRRECGRPGLAHLVGQQHGAGHESGHVLRSVAGVLHLYLLGGGVAGAVAAGPVFGSGVAAPLYSAQASAVLSGFQAAHADGGERGPGAGRRQGRQRSRRARRGGRGG
eukprot:ctg_2544.g680